MENMKATDALFGFAAWLTTREEVVAFGGSESAAPAAELVGKFVEANDLGEPSPEYPESFVMPVESSQDG
jgi:hypothetical protein